jgi:hypothetical protein
MITEQLIDATVERFADSATHATVIAELEAEQPWLLAFLFSENMEVFTQTEREFLLFLTSVIWEVAKVDSGPLAQVQEDQLAKAEEHNWALLKEVKARVLRERFTVLFEDHPAAEEPLAFVEDAILDDEESPVTPEAREHLFVSMKTIIDALLRP